MLLLRVFGYSDLTGTTFAVFRQFQELAWSGLGLCCLDLIGGRSVAIQEGRTHDPGNGSRHRFLPPSKRGRIIEKHEGRSLRVVKDGLPIPMGKFKNQKGLARRPQLGLFPATLVRSGDRSAVPYDVVAVFRLPWILGVTC